jgi:hypothetical protein
MKRPQQLYCCLLLPLILARWLQQQLLPPAVCLILPASAVCPLLLAFWCCGCIQPFFHVGHRVIVVPHTITVI